MFLEGRLRRIVGTQKEGNAMWSRSPRRITTLWSAVSFFLALLPIASAQTGAIRQVHDPCIIKEKGTYCLSGIPIGLYHSWNRRLRL